MVTRGMAKESERVISRPQLQEQDCVTDVNLLGYSWICPTTRRGEGP